MNAAETLLGRLESVKPTGPDRWLALCPAHDDRKPSLSIRRADDRALIHCWAGCEASDVVAAIGLSLVDLFDDRQPHYTLSKRPALPTVRELIALLEFDLAVIECCFADILCGVAFTSEAQATAYDALKSIRQVLDVCHGHT